VSTAAAPPGATRLVQLAKASWPGTRGDELPPVAGFVTSAFSPLVAAVADLCLLRCFPAPPVPDDYGHRTAIVLASSTGDVATAAAVAEAVQAGTRVPPLLFYQSNHNAVAGHVAARWGLYGPVVCTMPGVPGDPGCPSALPAAIAEAQTCADLLIEDGDAGAALVIAANAYLDGTVDAAAMLIGPASWLPGLTPGPPHRRLRAEGGEQ
jgi:3-oxoacyl-(acyl-carrier-protein) synthase